MKTKLLPQFKGTQEKGKENKKQKLKVKYQIMMKNGNLMT